MPPENKFESVLMHRNCRCTYNAHFPAAKENRLIFIDGTGHTYQQKEQETADRILEPVQAWQREWE